MVWLEPFCVLFASTLCSLFTTHWIHTRKLFWGKVDNENETENQREKKTQFFVYIKIESTQTQTDSRIEWGTSNCVLSVLVRNRNHCIKRITKTAVAAEATASNGQKELKFRLKTHTQHICTGVCIPTQTLTDTYRRNFGSSSSNNNKMIHKATRTNTLYTRCRYQISECVCMAARCLSSFTSLSLSLSLSLNQNCVPALSHSLTLAHSFIYSFTRSLTHSVYSVFGNKNAVCVLF